MTGSARQVSKSRAVALTGLLLVSCIAGPASAQSVSEDSVKAAFVYRFTDYVDWPAPVQQKQQFTIAVLDDPQLAQELERICAGRQVKGHPIQVNLIHRQKEASDAQIVFLGAGDTDAHRRVIANLSGHPVLIVTDEDHGLDEGSTVNFMLVDHRLRFEISLNAAGRSGLKISSELLSVAARVEGHS
jgi:YfiR/HmsC-like